MPSSSSPRQRCSVVGCSVNSVACWRPVERPNSGSCLPERRARTATATATGTATVARDQHQQKKVVLSLKAWQGDGEKSWPIQRRLEGRRRSGYFEPDELSDSRN